MTKDTFDRLYNKNENNIDKTDVEFYKKLLAKKLSYGSRILGSISLFSISWLYALSLAGLSLGGIALSLAISAAASVSMYFIFSIGEPKLKDLGLTKKEWKELKKSSRLKEISSLVENSANFDKIKLEELQEKRIILEKELTENKIQTNKLLAKMLRQKQQEKQLEQNNNLNNEIIEQNSDIEIGL